MYVSIYHIYIHTYVRPCSAHTFIQDICNTYVHTCTYMYMDTYMYIYAYIQIVYVHVCLDVQLYMYAEVEITVGHQTISDHLACLSEQISLCSDILSFQKNSEI